MTHSEPVIRAEVAKGNAALIGYLPVGFPSVEQSIEVGKVLIDHGVDAIELGFPYSDPGMDGPIIQHATTAALERGVHLEDLFQAVDELSSTGTPVLSMTYWNPVHWYGVDRFAKDFAAAGGAGLITPDLPPEEAGEWIPASDREDLERIFLAAPSTSAKRMKTIVEASKGWVYAASTMGVTGARQSVDTMTASLVADIRAAGAPTVCVGLGVSNGAQAREIGSYADGVIVGSALLKPLVDSAFDQALLSIAELVDDLKSGVEGARS